MRTALLVLLVCAAADLVLCAALLAFVWLEYRRVRREAAREGSPGPSFAGQLGCLTALTLLGLLLLYGTAGLLLAE